MSTTISERALLNRINRRPCDPFERVGIIKSKPAAHRYGHATLVTLEGEGQWKWFEFDDLEKFARKLGVLNKGEKLARKPR